MKYIFITIYSFFLSTLFANAQSGVTDKEKLAQKTVIDFFQALADRNADAVSSNCTKDLLLLENGAIWNLDTLVLKIGQNAPADYKRVNTIVFIETKVVGKTAWTTYNNQADVTRNGKSGIVQWLETAILVMEDGRWKIKTLHSTLLKRTLP
ncbi:MAG: nuclear transport factor 2 family protein [Chitinophagaceae bacterium]